jgi:hypothetical protein
MEHCSYLNISSWTVSQRLRIFLFFLELTYLLLPSRAESYLNNSSHADTIRS